MKVGTGFQLRQNSTRFELIPIEASSDRPAGPIANLETLNERFEDEDSLSAIVPRTRGSRETQRGEGSRPRDPLWPDPSAFVYQGLNCVPRLEIVFAARGDARPPGDGAGKPFLS